MKTVRFKLDAAVQPMPPGRVNVRKLEGTSEAGLKAQQKNDDAAAAHDAALFAQRVRKRLGLTQLEFSRRIDGSLDIAARGPCAPARSAAIVVVASSTPSWRPKPAAAWRSCVARAPAQRPTAARRPERTPKCHLPPRQTSWCWDRCSCCSYRRDGLQRRTTGCPPVADPDRPSHPGQSVLRCFPARGSRTC